MIIDSFDIEAGFFSHKKKMMEGDGDRLYALYNHHQWLYIKAEIGPVYIMQGLLLWHEQNLELFEQQVYPILVNSYEKELVNGCEYFQIYNDEKQYQYH